MANIKLTGNTWDTSGIYDATQQKTQAAVNADVFENEERVDVLYDGYPRNTIRNVSVVSFDDGLGGSPIEELVVDIVASQSGTGTPSPTNPRLISGCSNANIYRSGEDTSDPTTYEIEFPANVGTVYGGVLDVVNKTLKVTHKRYDLGALSWTYSTSGTYPYFYIGRFYEISRASGQITCLCEVYDAIPNTKATTFRASNNDLKMCVNTWATYPELMIMNSNYTDAATFTTAMSGKYVVCKLGTPTEYDLTDSQIIALLQGQNNIWTDAGNIESIKYIVNPNIAEEEKVKERIGGVSSDALLYLDKVPSYFTSIEATPTTYDEAYSYLENKISDIPSGKSFIFITDTHWEGNKKHSVPLINYVRKRTGIRKVLFGGDLLGYELTPYLFVKKGGEFLMQSRQAFGADFIPCVGDHDNNTSIVPNSGNTIADQFVAYTEVARMYTGDLNGIAHPYQPAEKLADYATGTDYNECLAFFRTVYYVDDSYSKIRYISLNCGCGDCNYGAMYNVFGIEVVDVVRLQIDWLAETLMSTPNGYDIVILSHKLQQGGNAVRGALILLSGFARALSVCQPYSSATSSQAVNSWYQSYKSFDFSKRPNIGKIVSMSGHLHRDALLWSGLNASDVWTNESAYNGTDVLNQSTKGQIPIIITQTDSLGAVDSPSAHTMTANTVTEQCFDVVTLTDDGVALTRFGAGDDRKVYISNAMT